MRANYTIIIEDDSRVVINDIGPWSIHKTVTNDAEGVVADLALRLKGRRLFCYDSEGVLDELLVKDGEFAGFKAGRE